jgi:hypothetical protein
MKPRVEAKQRRYHARKQLNGPTDAALTRIAVSAVNQEAQTLLNNPRVKAHPPAPTKGRQLENPMNNHSPVSKSSSATDNLADAARYAVDSVRSTIGDAVDRGQVAMSQAGAAANDMADSASRQITTFASELTAMTRRNPFGTLAGAAWSRES